MMLESCTSVKTFKIILTKATATYIPGEMISGKVVVELNAAIKCRGIKITLHGSARTHWKESSIEDGEQSKEHEASKRYFCREVYIFGEADGSTALPSGVQIFTFSERLPEDIPSNFNHKNGEVCYSIEATIDSIWIPNNTTKIPFKVNSPNDLDKYLCSPIEDSVNRNYSGCCLLPCLGRGCVNARIKISNYAYAIGEPIHACVELDSESIELSRVGLWLEQKLKFSCQDCQKRRWVSRTVMSTTCNGPFFPGIPIEVGFEVPRLPHSNFPGCHIMSVDYLLHVELILPGCHSNIEKVYAIQIGSRSEAAPALLSTDPSTSRGLPGTVD